MSSPHCYILHLPIADQIKNFIHTFYIKVEKSEIQEDPYFRSDVQSGENYQRLRQNAIINDTTITLQINTDGAQTFKSSKYGMWPLMGIINEAPYQVRRSSIILIALWYGNKKPPRKTLLDRAI